MVPVSEMPRSGAFGGTFTFARCAAMYDPACCHTPRCFAVSRARQHSSRAASAASDAGVCNATQKGMRRSSVKATPSSAPATQRYRR